MYKPSKRVSCSGKCQFTSFSAALRTIPKLLVSRMTIYRCHICSMYHVGNSTKKNRTNHTNIIKARDERKLID